MRTREPIVVEIGNFPIEIQTDSPAFRDALFKRYSPFVCRSHPYCRFDVQLIEAGEKILSEEDDDDGGEDLQVKMNGGKWTMSRGDFYAEWDPLSRCGKIRQSLNPYSVDAVLRIVHSLILAQEGGFLLHAASAVLRGRALIFSGVSGAGKTTISRLAPSDATLLTDEISYIKPAEGVYRAFGTPFAGELAKLGENESAPITGVFLLEKGPENRIDDMVRPEALRKILRNILFFAEDAALVKQIFTSVLQFTETVPVRRLVFKPDQHVWEALRHLVP